MELDLEFKLPRTVNNYKGGTVHPSHYQKYSSSPESSSDRNTKESAESEQNAEFIRERFAVFIGEDYVKKSTRVSSVQDEDVIIHEKVFVPTAWCAVKTKITSDNTKVFLNVCYTNDLPNIDNQNEKVRNYFKENGLENFEYKSISSLVYMGSAKQFEDMKVYDVVVTNDIYRIGISNPAATDEVSRA